MTVKNKVTVPIRILLALLIASFLCGATRPASAGNFSPDGQDQGDDPGWAPLISPDIGLCTDLLPMSQEERREKFALLEPLGKRLLRETFRWHLIEPQKGVFRWEAVDALVADAESAGFEIFPILMAAPAWAGGSDSTIGAHPPEDPADFGAFVSAVVSRYKGRIKYYQFWNEPNMPRFFGARKAEPAEFVALLKAGYEAGKQVDPGAVFIMGGVTRIKADSGYLAAVFKAGALDACDRIAVHLYADTVAAFEEEMAVVWKAMSTAGRSKPVWVTETGWPSRELDIQRLGAELGKRGITREQFKKSVVLRRAVGWVYEFTPEEARRARDKEALAKELEELGITEESLDALLQSCVRDRREQQAAAIKELSALVEKEPRIDKVFWYRFQDKFDVLAKAGNFGLIDVEGKPKRVYEIAAGKVDRKGESGGVEGGTGAGDRPRER